MMLDKSTEVVVSLDNEGCGLLGIHLHFLYSFLLLAKTELEFRSAVSGFASPICWLSSANVCGGSHMVLTKPKKETG